MDSLIKSIYKRVFCACRCKQNDIEYAKMYVEMLTTQCEETPYQIFANDFTNTHLVPASKRKLSPKGLVKRIK